MHDQATTTPAEVDVPYIGVLNAAASGKSRVAPSTRLAFKLALIPAYCSAALLSVWIEKRLRVHFVPEVFIGSALIALLVAPVLVVGRSVWSFVLALRGLSEPCEPPAAAWVVLGFSAIAVFGAAFAIGHM